VGPTCQLPLCPCHTPRAVALRHRSPGPSAAHARGLVSSSSTTRSSAPTTPPPPFSSLSASVQAIRARLLHYQSKSPPTKVRAPTMPCRTRAALRAAGRCLARRAGRSRVYPRKRRPPSTSLTAGKASPWLASLSTLQARHSLHKLRLVRAHLAGPSNHTDDHRSTPAPPSSSVQRPPPWWRSSGEPLPAPAPQPDSPPCCHAPQPVSPPHLVIVLHESRHPLFSAWAASPAQNGPTRCGLVWPWATHYWAAGHARSCAHVGH
jgi:hypothetical protein